MLSFSAITKKTSSARKWESVSEVLSLPDGRWALVDKSSHTSSPESEKWVWTVDGWCLGELQGKAPSREEARARAEIALGLKAMPKTFTRTRSAVTRGGVPAGAGAPSTVDVSPSWRNVPL